MNPIALNLPAPPTRLVRLGLFTFLALPGAFLVGTCASLIIYVTANFADAALDCFIAIPLALGAVLLLFGTRTTAEPLFLLVFVPMPILITLGFHLGYLGRDAGFPIAVVGMIWPALTYPRISRYYKRRATMSPQDRTAAVPAAAATNASERFDSLHAPFTVEPAAAGTAAVRALNTTPAQSV